MEMCKPIKSPIVYPPLKSTGSLVHSTQRGKNKILKITNRELIKIIKESSRLRRWEETIFDHEESHLNSNYKIILIFQQQIDVIAYKLQLGVNWKD